MDRYLLRVLVSVVLFTLSASAFSQVKLADNSEVTKFYDGGTRITYLGMNGFPNSDEMREFVTKRVLEHPDVSRAVIYKDGKTFMYEAKTIVDPDMIVEIVNDILEEYIAEVGELPEMDENKKVGLPNSSIREEKSTGNANNNVGGVRNGKGMDAVRVDTPAVNNEKNINSK